MKFYKFCSVSLILTSIVLNSCFDSNEGMYDDEKLINFIDIQK